MSTHSNSAFVPAGLMSSRHSTLLFIFRTGANCGLNISTGLWNDR